MVAAVCERRVIGMKAVPEVEAGGLGNLRDPWDRPAPDRQKSGLRRAYTDCQLPGPQAAES